MLPCLVFFVYQHVQHNKQWGCQGQGQWGCHGQGQDNKKEETKVRKKSETQQISACACSALVAFLQSHD